MLNHVKKNNNEIKNVVSLHPNFSIHLLLTKFLIKMKKLFLFAVVAAGLTFVSCTDKKTTEPETPEVEAAAEKIDVQAAVDESIAALSDNIEKKDATAFEAAITAVKEKVAEFLSKNPEVAKEYLAKVQEFLKDKKDAIAAVVGSNAAVASLVDGLANLPTESVEKMLDAKELLKNVGLDTAASAVGLVEGATDAVEDAKDAVEGKVEDVKDAAADAVDKAKDAADNAKEAAGEAVEKAKDAAAGAVDKAASDAAAAAKKKLGL